MFTVVQQFPRIPCCMFVYKPVDIVLAVDLVFKVVWDQQFKNGSRQFRTTVVLGAELIHELGHGGSPGPENPFFHTSRICRDIVAQALLLEATRGLLLLFKLLYR